MSDPTATSPTFPNGALPLALLMERFTLRKGEGEMLVGDCPVDHGIEASFDAHPTDQGWRITYCELGCLPREIWEAANIDRRQPGEDDGEPAKPKAQVLDDRVIALSRDSLRATPADRVYLLRDSNTGDGVFIRGRVGMLAAAGGSGKSWALAQLAIAVATGTTWFGSRGWSPVGVGRVLMILAEEEKEEVHRMLHFAARAAQLGDQDLDAVASRITAIDVTGLGVALVSPDDRSGALPETRFAKALRELVVRAYSEGNPYTLIILDPLSYFGGFDVEKDNTAATRWVQVARTLTTPECGGCSVIVAHHEKKRQQDEETTANVIRGPSALKDGVRWAAVLEQERRSEGSADLVTLRVVKANGVPPREPLVLCRSNEFEGVLRVATPDEVSSHEGVSRRAERKREKLQKYVDYVISNLSPGGICNSNEFIRSSNLNRQGMLAAIRVLVADGTLERPAKGSISRPVPGGSKSGSGTGSGSGSMVPDPRKGVRTGNQEPSAENQLDLGSGSRTGTKAGTDAR